LACDGHFGIRLIPMDFYIGIALIILETDVVFWTVLLDEVHLKDERFKLRADHDPLNIGNVARGFSS
jgi:hypothetical protein